MRTTIDLTAEAYYVARTVAREQGRSMGKVISDFILHSSPAPAPPAPTGSGELFPSFRCVRRVTSEDVKALEDE